jgi:hypothetical protein
MRVNRVRTDQGPNHTVLRGDKPGSSREGKEGVGVPLGNVLWQEAQGVKDLREESTKYTQVNSHRSIHTDQYIQRNVGQIKKNKTVAKLGLLFCFLFVHVIYFETLAGMGLMFIYYLSNVPVVV